MRSVIFYKAIPSCGIHTFLLTLFTCIASSTVVCSPAHPVSFLPSSSLPSLLSLRPPLPLRSPSLITPNISVTTLSWIANKYLILQKFKNNISFLLTGYWAPKVSILFSFFEIMFNPSPTSSSSNYFMIPHYHPLCPLHPV